MAVATRVSQHQLAVSAQVFEVRLYTSLRFTHQAQSFRQRFESYRNRRQSTSPTLYLTQTIQIRWKEKRRRRKEKMLELRRREE